MTATTIQTTEGQPASASLPHNVLLAGARTGLPVILGFAPFALFIGATVAESSMNNVAGWAGSWLIFTGTAHVVAIQLLDAGAALTIVVGTAAIVNLRLLVYSAGMATPWRSAPTWFKILGAYLLVDPTFAVGSHYAEQTSDETAARAFYLGAAAAMWACWITLVGVGVAIGPTVAPLLPGDTVILLALLALVVPAIGDRTTRTAAAVAVLVALPASVLPMSLGPFVAGAAGIAVASTLDRDGAIADDAEPAP